MHIACFFRFAKLILNGQRLTKVFYSIFLGKFTVINATFELAK